jgi:hypothetical protein
MRGSSGTLAKDGGRGGALGGPTRGLLIVAKPSWTVEHGIIYRQQTWDISRLQASLNLEIHVRKKKID